MSDEAREREEATLNAVIDQCNQAISAEMETRRKAEKRKEELRRQDSELAMRNFVVLAAQHLTPGEGPMVVGHVVNATDVAALHKVTSFVASHLSCVK